MLTPRSTADVARFLTNNFGEAANCMGRPHLDMVIKSFQKIQSKLFSAEAARGGNFIDHLRSKLYDRFGVVDIPDGFFLFPVELGGLGLVNPFIPLFEVQKDSLADPMKQIQLALEHEETNYERAKEEWENGTKSRYSALAHEDFMSLDEYTRYLEETSVHLARAYKRLMTAPMQDMTIATPKMLTAMRDLPRTSNPVNYDEWVRELYGPEIVKRYGGLAMGDARLLPVGLVDMLKGEKIRWQG